MGIKKRVSALLLAVSLSFGVCATDYLEVQALEWAGVTIGLDTALKFLLGLVGVSVGVGVADSIDWTETREQCITFQQNQGNSAVAVSNWWADVIRGKLDTASECWQSFKEWVKNDLLNNTPSGDVTLGSGTIQNLLYQYKGVENVRMGNLAFDVSLTDTYNFICVVYINNGNMYFCLSDSVIRSVDANSRYWNYFAANVSNLIGYEKDSYGYYYLNSYSDAHTIFLVPDGSATTNYIFNKPYLADACLDTSITNTISNKQECYNRIMACGDLSLDGSIAIPSDFDSAFSNVTDIGLGSSIATDLPQEGILDIPWENVGDTSESVDGAIDNALENVNTGTWTLDQYWEYVQNITNVYAYDITNNYLLPNDGSNETTEDKVQENVSRGAFVLAGLEKVFPFCIPWDIYAFVTLLVADPVAPVIEYPLYNPVTDSEEIITIDFSVWEDQVIIMRYIFDFLLIIGLLLLARSLIGAGGSD